MAFVFAVLMWGVVDQGYNAVFPGVSTRNSSRPRRGVTAFAVSQNIGTLITAVPPGDLRRAGGPTTRRVRGQQEVRPRRSASEWSELPGGGGRDRECDVVWTVGSITFGLAIIASIAAFTARETYRIHLNDLGDKNAQPVPKEEYDQIRRAGTSTAV
jgi:hypothetical protein